jgi:hypothetical protein
MIGFHSSVVIRTTPLISSRTRKVGLARPRSRLTEMQAVETFGGVARLVDAGQEEHVSSLGFGLASCQSASALTHLGHRQPGTTSAKRVVVRIEP